MWSVNLGKENLDSCSHDELLGSYHSSKIALQCTSLAWFSQVWLYDSDIAP